MNSANQANDVRSATVQFRGTEVALLMTTYVASMHVSTVDRNEVAGHNGGRCLPANNSRLHRSPDASVIGQYSSHISSIISL